MIRVAGGRAVPRHRTAHSAGARRYTTRKWDLQRAVSSGGMPSSHTALIVGVTSATGVQEGIGSSIFALCLVVTLIVSYDAAGVRRAAGKHAAVLNALLSELPVHHPAHVPLRSGEQLDAKLGHTPLQVFAGMGVGLVVGVLWQTLR